MYKYGMKSNSRKKYRCASLFETFKQLYDCDGENLGIILLVILFTKMISYVQDLKMCHAQWLQLAEIIMQCNVIILLHLWGILEKIAEIFWFQS